MADPDDTEKLRRIVAACNGVLDRHFWKGGDLCFSIEGIEEPTALQARKLNRVFTNAYAATHTVTVKADDGIFIAIFALLPT